MSCDWAADPTKGAHRDLRHLGGEARVHREDLVVDGRRQGERVEPARLSVLSECAAQSPLRFAQREATTARVWMIRRGFVKFRLRLGNGWLFLCTILYEGKL